ncbi:hypothetical protein JKG47_09940 [Acidithiobacillus sp. MC6.1]|nr:hypothetical protein [Acidithiobacillus sp. MC6.1]
MRGGSASVAEWGALLDALAISGLCVSTFCKQAAVSTACIYRWRVLLQENGDSGTGTAEAVADWVPARVTPHRTATFLDFGALEDVAPAARRHCSAPGAPPETGWWPVLHLLRG